MTLVYGRSKEVCALVADLLGQPRGFDNCVGIGVERDDELYAGMLFGNWWPERGLIEVTAAGKGPCWVRREPIAAALCYAFVDLRARVLMARCSPRNRAFCRLAARLGAEGALVPHIGEGGEPEAYWMLTAQAWAQSDFCRRLHESS